MAKIVLPTDFTLDDLLCVLEEQEQVESSGFHTRREWEEILGASKYEMKRLLNLAWKRGVLLRDRHRRECMDGVVRSVPVYAFNVEKTSEDET